LAIGFDVEKAVDRIRFEQINVRFGLEFSNRRVISRRIGSQIHIAGDDGGLAIGQRE
jgi:hypothetical protein